MSTLNLAIIAQQAGNNAIVALLDGGTLELRSGIQPASANDGVTGSLIAVLTLGTPAFGNSDATGQSVMNVASEAVALVDGTITWARLKNNVGGAVMDADVTDAAGDGFLKLDKVIVVTGEPIAWQSLTAQLPASEV